MRASAPLYPLPELLLGSAIAVGAFFTVVGLASACGTSLATCRIEAVGALPPDVISDPDLLTLGDTKRLAQKLRRCNEQATGDAGP